jgi:serine/threonine protein kinase
VLRCCRVFFMENDWDYDKTTVPNYGMHSSHPGAPDTHHGSAYALPSGTRLGEFEIVRLIFEGDFGIVYLAYDHALERNVALKEYMPLRLAWRTASMHVAARAADGDETFQAGLRSFINEAKLLTRFDSPSLIKVFRFWEENGTAYRAMPFHEGVTLKQALGESRIAPSEAWIKAFLAHLFDAVESIHAMRCYHRDITPDNILLLEDGRPLLLGFGAARRAIANRTQGPAAILKPGFAPIEQYADISSLKQGPWTDIYALGAVAYYLVAGKPPPPAVSRIVNDEMVPARQAGMGQYQDAFLRALDHALAIKPEHRIQSVAQLRGALGIGAGVADAMPPIGSSTRAAEPQGAPSRLTPQAGAADTGFLESSTVKHGMASDAARNNDAAPTSKWLPPYQSRRASAWAAASALFLAAVIGAAYWSSRYPASGQGGAPAPAQATSVMAAKTEAPSPYQGQPGPDAAGAQEKLSAGKTVPEKGAGPEERLASGNPQAAQRTPSKSAEDTLWDLSTSLNNAFAYKAYLSEYPKGRYSPIAKARLDRIQKTKSEQLDSSIAAQETFPGRSAAVPPLSNRHARPGTTGMHAPTPAGTDLEEDDLWNAVRDMDKPLAYESFLNKYPDSRHAPAARSKLASSSGSAVTEQQVAAAPAASRRSNDRPGDERNALSVKDMPVSVKPDGASAPLAKAQPESASSLPPETGPAIAPIPARDSKTIRLANQTMIGNFSPDPVSGVVSGRGRVVWDNGDRFEGTLVHGVKQGKGEFTWANGQRYKGDWARDLPNGKGSIYFANGNRYEGDMKDGVPNGAGMIYFSNGNRYRGEVKDGLPHGRGVNQFTNGDVYSGAWSRGKSNGHGRYTWTNGNYWEGEFKDDKQTDHGQMVFAGNAAGSTPPESATLRKDLDLSAREALGRD